MHPFSSIGAGVLAVALCLSPQGEPGPQLPPSHLALVLQGDVTALRVTTVVPKPTPCGKVPKGLKSEFRLAVLDAKGNELWSQPLDLSPFDTDPAHIGQPLQVTGCQVHDWRIAMLVNVPDFANADRIVFWHGKQAIGSATAGELLRLRGGK